MNKLWALTKIQLKDFFSRYTQQLNIKNKWMGKLMILLPILIMLPAFELVRQLYLSFASIGYPELTLTYLYVGTTMFVFFSGIPVIISVFFYAKDLMLNATLPVKDDTVVFSKLASVYVYLVVISAALFGMGVGYSGLYDGIKPLSLILGILGVLLTPLMPMIFSTLVILPFMSFVGGRKNRNLMVIVGNVLLLITIIALQLLFTRIQMDPASLQKYVASSDGLIALIGSKFPPNVWLTKMIMGSWFDTLLYVLLNFAFVIVLKVTASRLYKGALLKYNQERGGGTVVKNGKLDYTMHSKRYLLIKRHLGIITSNPTFLLNIVLTIFVPLLLFGIYFAMGIMNLDTFKNPMFKPFLVYIYAGIISAPVIMGTLSATVITREGKTFWETRVLPISVNENLLTRIMSSVILNGGASLILAFAAVWIMPLTALDIVLALIFCIMATLCFSTMDLLINIQRPYLNWSNPTAAVKNNLNIMIAFLPRLVFGGIGFFMVKLMPDFGGHFITALFSVLLFIGFLMSYALVFGRFRVKFINIDA